MRYIKSFANDSAIQEAVDNKTLGKPYVALNESAGTIDWNGKEETPDYSKMYLTIEALENGTFNLGKNLYSYSVNNGGWIIPQSQSYSYHISLSKGDKVRFKANMTTINGNNGMFTGNTMSFVTYGNIESLEYGDDFEGKTAIRTSYSAAGAFSNLFQNSTGLKNVSNLILPATSLNQECYWYMFAGCSSITKAPDLPAVNLTTGCYRGMFSGCTSLNYVKSLAEGFKPSQGYTNSWLEGVAASGTFVKSPNTPTTTSNTGNGWYRNNAKGIPSGWTVVDAQ